MRVVLVSRYPRVDVPAWKRDLAQGLLDGGFDVSVLYSRSSLADQALAGLRELGPAGVRRALALRARPDRDAPSAHPLGAWARERGVEVLEFGRLDEPDCLGALRARAADVLVLAGSDLVPRAVLEVPRRATINAHYGLLPRYRGMNVTEWSIYNDDPVGVSVHVVDPGIDTGDILAREEIAAQPGETLETLRAKHQELAARLLLETVRRIAAGGEERRPQRPEDGRQYYRMHPLLRAVVEHKLATGSYRPFA